MTPEKLKELRSQLGSSQKGLAGMLGIPARTYQNWEQPTDSKSHRDIPCEVADKVETLAGLKKEPGGSYIPKNLQWLSLPLLPNELKALEKQAANNGTSIIAFIRDIIRGELS